MARIPPEKSAGCWTGSPRSARLITCLEDLGAQPEALDPAFKDPDSLSEVC